MQWLNTLLKDVVRSGFLQPHGEHMGSRVTTIQNDLPVIRRGKSAIARFMSVDEDTGSYSLGESLGSLVVIITTPEQVVHFST